MSVLAKSYAAKGQDKDCRTVGARGQEKKIEEQERKVRIKKQKNQPFTEAT